MQLTLVYKKKRPSTREGTLNDAPRYLRKKDLLETDFLGDEPWHIYPLENCTFKHAMTFFVFLTQD